MTMHLFGTVLTAQGVASNNRGELGGGSLNTIQKVIRDGEIFSTVSGEAIRYAIREGWATGGQTVNRDVRKPPAEAWVDKEFKKPDEYLDNDVLGYMHAKKETISHRGLLEIGRAVSITPWPGTISAHFASPGSNPGVTHDNPIPYRAEIHDTRYQYSFALTPDGLAKQKFDRTEKSLHALRDLRRVGGCHARFLFDFAPEAIVLRWTTDPAPRIMFVFDQDDRGRVSLKKLFDRTKTVRQQEVPDVDPKELYIGTAIDGIYGLNDLKAADANVYGGVKAAVAAVLEKIKGNIK